MPTAPRPGRVRGLTGVARGCPFALSLTHSPVSLVSSIQSDRYDIDAPTPPRPTPGVPGGCPRLPEVARGCPFALSLTHSPVSLSPLVLLRTILVGNGGLFEALTQPELTMWCLRGTCSTQLHAHFPHLLASVFAPSRVREELGELLELADRLRQHADRRLELGVERRNLVVLAGGS